MNTIKATLCQINPTVGDIQGNSKKILRYYQKAMQDYSPDLILFPECSVTGYPPEDLLLRESFIKESESATAKIAESMKDSVTILGTIHGKRGHCYNSAAVISHGKIQSIYFKNA